MAIALIVSGLAGGQAPSSPECKSMSLPTGAKLIQAYSAGDFPAVQEGREVSVEVPPIDFTGAGRSSTLPIGPCQHIYRFKFPQVHAASGDPSPFHYVEVDWNTEGEPRGPKGSFLSPHFDFHFYLPSRAEMDAKTKCPVGSNGKTCDGLRTPYAQMRRFLRLPPPAYVPPTYRPDVDSSIPLMGMHLLDSRFTYTVPYVDHNPVLLYGTFNGKVAFVEASVTLETLEDVMAKPGHPISYPFRQPQKVLGGVPWPTSFTLEYLPATHRFRAGFSGLRTR